MRTGTWAWCLALACAGSGPCIATGRADGALASRLDRLEESTRQVQRQIEGLRQSLAEQRVAEKLDTGGEKVRISLDYKDGFRIATADLAFSLAINGRLQTDGRARLGSHGSATTDFLIRRAFLTASGQVHRDYGYMVEVDFSGPRPTLLEAWVELRWYEEAMLRLGQTQVPFGLEWLTSDKYVKLIERSMATDFITPFYDTGAYLHGKLAGGRIEYAAGLYNGAGIARADDGDDKDVVGRLVFRPFAPSPSAWLKGIHLGGGVTHGRQPDRVIAGTGPTTPAGSTLFTYASGVRQAGDRTRVGLEGAWHAGPFGVSGEYLQLDQELVRSGERRDGSARGWYSTASLFLTGEEASFGRVHPRRPFDPAAGRRGPGAWELAARVGQLAAGSDLAPFTRGPGRATQYDSGLNWYPNSMLRLSLNLTHARLDGGGSEDTLIFRCQIEF